ncbi:MAG: flagellar brake protein [Pseudomonadota bacterium]
MSDSASESTDNAPKGRQAVRLIGLNAYSDYLVRSPVEVTSILRSLQKAARQITAYFDDSERGFLATTIVHVDPKKDMVLLERGGGSVEEKMLETREVLFDTKHNNVTVQFTAESVQPARMQGEPVFLVPMPKELLRLQRRQAFRAPVPRAADDPVTCSFSDHQGEIRTLTVADLSIGGLGLIDEQCEVELDKYTTLPGSIIHLQDMGEISVELEVRNLFDTTLPNGRQIRRIGCRFTGLNNATEAILQRFIHRLETEGRA